MPSDTPLTDDVVAEILRKEATRISNPYLNGGLSSLTSGRRSTAPKPNTRFLRNIIRDTDSHNAALKAREEAESRARLRLTRPQKEISSRSSTKHRRDENRTRRSSHNHGRDRRDRSSRSTAVNQEYDDEDSSRRKRRRHNDGPETNTRRETRSRNRTRSPSPSDVHESKDSRSKTREVSPLRGQIQRKDSNRYDSDSDSPDGGIGPLPPPKVKPRGRGAYKASSIDTRFSPNYDPAQDVGANPENGDGDGDWEKALRAIRDRAKWRKGRTERLLAAGFTDEEVQNIERGADGRHEEKDAADVRWSKKGEGREWDRGKIFNGNSVDIVPEWGRLKGT